MVWSILIWIYLIYEPDWHHNRVLRALMPLLLITYGLGFAILHAIYRWTTGFQVHFALIVAICLTRVYKHYQACEEESGRRLARVYVYTLLVGFSLWLMDFHLCSTMRSLPFNPQGHAWWHVGMGINTYFGPAFAQYTRATQLGWRPIVKTKWGVPYVSATKIA
jgi:dihydroceramidase